MILINTINFHSNNEFNFELHAFVEEEYVF